MKADTKAKRRVPKSEIFKLSGTIETQVKLLNQMTTYLNKQVKVKFKDDASDKDIFKYVTLLKELLELSKKAVGIKDVLKALKDETIKEITEKVAEYEYFKKLANSQTEELTDLRKKVLLLEGVKVKYDKLVGEDE